MSKFNQSKSRRAMDKLTVIPEPTRGPSRSSSRFQFTNATGGQAIVEYLIVGLAIIAIVAALSLLGGAIGSGMFTQHAADSASHSVTTNTAGSIGDVLLY